ncbi:MAG: hypothetical protein QOF68_3061, partial [Gaiellales bacterium]|nr:hypothetical protein [Gaiellales bacterium]
SADSQVESELAQIKAELNAPQAPPAALGEGTGQAAETPPPERQPSREGTEPPA